MSEHQEEQEVFSSAPLEEPNTPTFVARIDEVAELYQAAFAGYPWFEDLDTEYVQERMQKHAMLPGLEAFIIEGNDGRIVGGLWYNTPDRAELVEERGEALGQFVDAVRDATGIEDCVWTREAIVHPDVQGRGLATKMRTDFLDFVTRAYPQGALVLTRMRGDNHGIIKISTRFGYKRTGIKAPCPQKPEVNNEIWYKIVNDPRVENAEA